MEAPAGILALAGIQGLFVFLAFMHGRYGPVSVGIFMILSLLTVVPLFVALLFSVGSPPHVGGAPKLSPSPRDTERT